MIRPMLASRSVWSCKVKAECHSFSLHNNEMIPSAFGSSSKSEPKMNVSGTFFFFYSRVRDMKLQVQRNAKLIIMEEFWICIGLLDLILHLFILSN